MRAEEPRDIKVLEMVVPGELAKSVVPAMTMLLFEDT